MGLVVEIPGHPSGNARNLSHLGWLWRQRESFETNNPWGRFFELLKDFLRRLCFTDLGVFIIIEYLYGGARCRRIFWDFGTNIDYLYRVSSYTCSVSPKCYDSTDF